AHPCLVLADADERLAEIRVDERAEGEKPEREDYRGIHVRHAAEQVERELPCRPSAPPVSQPSRFASSCMMRTVARLSMINVSRRLRSSTTPATMPRIPAAAPPASRPKTGSADARSAKMPAV